jgi:hypothetical protein
MMLIVLGIELSLLSLAGMSMDIYLVGFSYIHTLFIIHQGRNSEIHILSIGFRVSI